MLRMTYARSKGSLPHPNTPARKPPQENVGPGLSGEAERPSRQGRAPDRHHPTDRLEIAHPHRSISSRRPTSPLARTSGLSPAATTRDNQEPRHSSSNAAISVISPTAQGDKCDTGPSTPKDGARQPKQPLRYGHTRIPPHKWKPHPL